jgi:DNA-binding beta-propeller fold protein YncE
MGDDEVLIANRTAGTLSVINIRTKELSTFLLPVGDSQPEPMYLVYSPANNLVYVGDRGNNRLIVYKAKEYSEPIGFVPVGAGVFHIWGERAHNQLWVNNDLDHTISIVDMIESKVIETISIPTSLQTGKLHDIIVDPNAPFAYASVLGVDDGAFDVILKFSTETFEEVDRLVVGDHTHFTLSDRNNLLYAPSETDDSVVVLDRDTLDIVSTLPVANTHGAALSADAKTFFTTNFLAGGVGGLISIDADTNTINSVVDTPFSVPHNIVISPDQTELYLTHSGKSNTMVTIWDISDHKAPVLMQSIETGVNPFGIVVVRG